MLPPFCSEEAPAYKSNLWIPFILPTENTVLQTNQASFCGSLAVFSIPSLFLHFCSPPHFLLGFMPTLKSFTVVIRDQRLSSMSNPSTSKDWDKYFNPPWPGTAWLTLCTTKKSIRRSTFLSLFNFNSFFLTLKLILNTQLLPEIFSGHYNSHYYFSFPSDHSSC